VLLLLGGAAGGYVLYDMQQQEILRKQKEEEEYKRQQAELRRQQEELRKQQEEIRLRQLKQELETAAFGKPALERFLQSCEPNCPEDMKTEAQSRLSVIAAEEETYRAARDSPEKLQEYATRCKVCAFRAEAQTQASQLLAERERKRQEEERLRAQQERAARVEAEQRTYNAARGDQTALESYVEQCEICTFKNEAREEIARIIESKKRWNAVAASIWKVRGRVFVAVGYSGLRRTADEAEASAIDRCRGAGGRNCKVQGPFDFGCVYITTGSTARRAGWTSGPSSENAYNRCRASGFSCKTPIGGCVE
jgi:hypothetical protein